MHVKVYGGLVLTPSGQRCRDRRSELDEAQLNLAALKTLSDEADLLRARVAELEPLQVWQMVPFTSRRWQLMLRGSNGLTMYGMNS